MSEEAALLNAIRAHPDEDTPRLVYADWLQENDRPERAEFIRLQCAIARLPDSAPEKAEKQTRVNVLLEEHEEEWFDTLRSDFEGCEIERGFVTDLGGNAGVFRKHARKIVRAAPVLHSARVWSVCGTAATVLKLPFFEWVREVSLDRVEPRSLEPLKKFVPPANLTSVTIYTNRLREADRILPLLDAPILRNPARLGLCLDLIPSTYPGLDEEIRLAGVQNLRVLDRLDLPNLRTFGFWGVNNEVAERLAAWPGLARLDTLSFYCSMFQDSALPILLASPLLPNIKKAILDANDLGDTAAEAIANCPKFAGLTYLDLGENEITNRGANALADSKYLKNLTYFDLRRNQIGPRAWKKLAKRFGKAFQEEE
jgi:uncharacterized protein (TIGR02996 family)